MTATFRIRRGDTREPVTGWLHDATGTPIPLESIRRVRFELVESWSDAQNDALVRGRADILDPEKARVRYDWNRGETDLEDGHYLGRFVVEYADGSRLTVPNDPSFRVTIID